jgi:hypothetical protein
MKTESGTLQRPKGRPLAFALVCLLIASSGWAARLALAHYEAMDDAIISDLAKPSQFYTWAYGKPPARDSRSRPSLAHPAQPGLAPSVTNAPTVIP